jgi:hypothetical protein
MNTKILGLLLIGGLSVMSVEAADGRSRSGSDADQTPGDYVTHRGADLATAAVVTGLVYSVLNAAGVLDTRPQAQPARRQTEDNIGAMFRWGVAIALAGFGMQVVENTVNPKSSDSKK